MKLEDVPVGASEPKESHPNDGIDVEDFASTANKNQPRSNDAIDLESPACTEDDVLGGEIVSEEILFYRDFGEENLYAFDTHPDKNRDIVGTDSESVERTEEVVVSEGANSEGVAENAGAGACGTDEKGNEDMMKQLLQHVQALTKKQEEQAQEIDELKKSRPLEMDEDEKYLPTSYTWIELHSKPSFVFFGLIVYLFQMVLIAVMGAGVAMSRGLSEEITAEQKADAGIPGRALENYLGSSQVLAAIAFMIFPETCVMDVVQGLRYFPRGCCCCCSWATFACGLKLGQGLSAGYITFVLILLSTTPLEVLLNFAAMSYISGLDEHAFELSKMGLFGVSLRDECKRIAGEKADEKEPYKLPEDRKKAIQARPLHRFYFYGLLVVTAFTFITIERQKLYRELGFLME